MDYFLKKDIIIFGAHYDDIEIGVGGLIAKYGNREDTRIKIVIATHTGEERKTEQMESYEYLKKNYQAIKELILFPYDVRELQSKYDDLRHRIEKILYDENKQYVCLTHFPQDTHIDHRKLSTAVNDAARELSVIYYQSPSTYDFIPNFFISMNPSLLEEKIKMINFHQSQIKKNNGLFVSKVMAQATYHAMNVYEDYAEAYYIHKLKY